MVIAGAVLDSGNTWRNNYYYIGQTVGGCAFELGLLTRSPISKVRRIKGATMQSCRLARMVCGLYEANNITKFGLP